MDFDRIHEVVTLALVIPADLSGLAGFAYMLLPILHPIHGYFGGKREKEALARMESS